VSEIHVCEGVWRNRCGQRLVIIRCDPVDGQQWTDGLQHYSDDGTYCVNNRGQDLVVFVGLLPGKSQVDQSAEIARLQAEWQTEFTAAQQLRSENAQLERLLNEAREILQQLQADQAADEQHSEGERAAYLEMIKALWEMRS
jgi:hypothetical protein